MLRSRLACLTKEQVVDWFIEDNNHNIVYTFHNEKQNKDVYRVALREEGISKIVSALRIVKPRMRKCFKKSFLCAFYLNIIGNIRNFMKKYIIQPVNRFFSAGNPLQLIETFGSFITQQQSGEGSDVHF